MPRTKKTVQVDELENFVREVSGVPGAAVVKSISTAGEGATDETIERGTKLKLAEIRNILNVLHNYGIVEYTREKNMQSGWFTYTWKLNASRALQNRLLMVKRNYEQMRTRMVGDKVMIYKCPKNCGSMAFEEAMELNFACSSCGAKLKYSDETKAMKELETQITSLEKLVDTKMRLEPTGELGRAANKPE